MNQKPDISSKQDIQYIQYSISGTLPLPSSEIEEATLITLLRRWGITYLTGGFPELPSAIQPVNRESAPLFLQRLARCFNVRVRDATISLLILHPELAEAMQIALQESSQEEHEALAVLTLATLYLQRFWWYQLTLALGHPTAFPEEPFSSLWQTRRLPPPSAFGGRWGLRALEKAEQHRTGLPLTFSGDWQNQVHHLLYQEENRKKEREDSQVPALHLLSEEEQNLDIEVLEGKDLDMSMRPDVDRQAIERFLTELGRHFRQTGRLYLVGGAALVHAGIRPGLSANTQDIDLDVADGDMYQTINQLKQQLNINIEFASPGDFIPLPHNWQSLSRFVGRYGNIDVFYFDFYSIALSKIERGNSRDLQDVALLLQKRIITLAELDQAAQEVADQMGKGKYKRLDPDAFLARYQAIRQHLHP